MPRKSQLALMRQSRLQSGFTLFELLAAVAILAIVSVVGFFYATRLKEKADAEVKIAQAIQIAKECAAQQVLQNPDSPPIIDPVGIPIECNGTSEATVTGVTFMSRQTFACVGYKLTSWSAVLVVAKDGKITCI